MAVCASTFSGRTTTSTPRSSTTRRATPRARRRRREHQIGEPQGQRPVCGGRVGAPWPSAPRPWAPQTLLPASAATRPFHGRSALVDPAAAGIFEGAVSCRVNCIHAHTRPSPRRQPPPHPRLAAASFIVRDPPYLTSPASSAVMHFVPRGRSAPRATVAPRRPLVANVDGSGTAFRTPGPSVFLMVPQRSLVTCARINQ